MPGSVRRPVSSVARRRSALRLSGGTLLVERGARRRRGAHDAGLVHRGSLDLVFLSALAALPSSGAGGSFGGSFCCGGAAKPEACGRLTRGAAPSLDPRHNPILCHFARVIKCVTHCFCCIFINDRSRAQRQKAHPVRFLIPAPCATPAPQSKLVSIRIKRPLKKNNLNSARRKLSSERCQQER